MPARRVPAHADDGLCKRCREAAPALVVRTEPLCATCLGKYVETKVIKRMESFRVRHSEAGRSRKLLLAVSLGTCSVSLLCILSQLLTSQAKKIGRTGFQLHVLHVADDTITPSLTEQNGLLDTIKSQFPEHEVSSISLPDSLGADDLPILASPPLAGKDDTDGKEAEADHVAAMLARMTSVTARADTVDILRRKVIVHFARTHDCEAIVWGHSTTKLSERVLAETAKGRGSSMPWLVLDGQTPFGIPFYHPLRDLLIKEMEAYVELVQPSIKPMIANPDVKPRVSTRHTTIDELINQYVTGVEVDYPSIVANVVRTAGKLQPLSLGDVERHCELCDMPLHGYAPEMSRLCYGCLRNYPVVAD